jgi:hypothetical protein
MSLTLGLVREHRERLRDVTISFELLFYPEPREPEREPYGRRMLITPFDLLGSLSNLFCCFSR